MLNEFRRTVDELEEAIEVLTDGGFLIAAQLLKNDLAKYLAEINKQEKSALL